MLRRSIDNFGYPLFAWAVIGVNIAWIIAFAFSKFDLAMFFLWFALLGELVHRFYNIQLVQYGSVR